MIEGFLFSPELVKKCQEYFKSRYGLDISDADAQLYLDSLADLFLACSPL